MANISTSTVAYATRQTAGQIVFIASDGAACVLWCDGTNQVLAYDDNTYASWTKATLTTGLNMALAGHFRAGTDNIDEVTGGTSNVRGNYRLLTKSGATWTVGTSNALSGTTAIGVTAQGSPTNYIGQDGQGRHWVVVSGATNTLETCYYSAANSPTTTGWTASGAVTQTADLFTPAADQVGNYLIKIYWNGTALQWHRVDNSGSSVGSWSSGATIANLTGSPNASHAVNFKAISATQGLLTYSSGSGVYAQLYTAASDSFGAATQLSTNANDRHPTIAVDMASGRAWVVWCSYAAANNYALVFKMYNGTTWDSVATTLVASGTNIAYPNTGYGVGTLGVAFTQGTATPWTVGWITAAVGPFMRTIGATASFEGPGPLTLYGSATSLSSPLANSCGVATVAGGVETSKVSSFTGTGNLGEVWSKGGTVTCVSSLPTNPTGHGWGYQPGAGTFKGVAAWDAIITCAAGANSGSWRLRFFKYDGASTYTPITTLTTAITATAKTVYNFPGSTIAAVDFLATDWLVWDVYYEDTFGAASETATCYMATDATAGVANEMQITTPTFDPATISGGTRTITSDGALSLEKSRTITTVTAALLLEKSRPVTVTGSLSAARTLATSAALLLEKNRTSGTTTASLLLGKTRTITTVTGALFLVKSRPVTSTGSLAYLALSRNIGSSAALLLEKARTAGSSAALLLEKTRTAGSSVSLLLEKSCTGPSDAALSSLGTLTRTVPGTTSLSLTQRTVGSSAALFVEQSRAVGSSAALSRVGTRSIPTSVMLSLTQTRTAGSSATLFVQKTHTVPGSTALLLEKTRTLASTGSLSTPGTNTRTVPASGALSLAVRSIPTSVSLGTSTARTITATLALLVQKARTVPQTGAVSWQQSRGMASSSAILATKTRTLASSASCSLSSLRTLPSSAALLSLRSRTIPSSVALLVSRTRNVPATVSLSGARAIPVSVALKATSARSMTADTVLASGFDHIVPCSAALFLEGEERPCPAWVALSLFIANARVTVPSGYALVKLP